MPRSSRSEESANALLRLVGRAQLGDTAAFQQLVQRFDPGLHRILLRRSGGREDLADELRNDVWAAVWEALVRRRYDPQKGAISTFIYAVAHKLWLRHLRRVGHSPVSFDVPGLLEQKLVSEENPAALLHAAELLDAVRDCLHAPGRPFSLTAEERQVVVSLASGQTERSLGADWGVAPSTIHSRKVSAYRKLRRCMAAKGFLEDTPERGAGGGE